MFLHIFFIFPSWLLHIPSYFQQRAVIGQNFLKRPVIGRNWKSWLRELTPLRSVTWALRVCGHDSWDGSQYLKGRRASRQKNQTLEKSETKPKILFVKITSYFLNFNQFLLPQIENFSRTTPPIFSKFSPKQLWNILCQNCISTYCFSFFSPQILSKCI